MPAEGPDPFGLASDARAACAAAGFRLGAGRFPWSHHHRVMRDHPAVVAVLGRRARHREVAALLREFGCEAGPEALAWQAVAVAAGAVAAMPENARAAMPESVREGIARHGAPSRFLEWLRGRSAVQDVADLGEVGA